MTLNALFTITGRTGRISVLFSPNAMSYGLIETMLCLTHEECEKLDMEWQDIERWDSLEEFVNVMEKLQSLY